MKFPIGFVSFSKFISSWLGAFVAESLNLFRRREKGIRAAGLLGMYNIFKREKQEAVGYFFVFIRG
jgi:hypothetical protein